MRGRDASGAAWSDADGVWWDKAPLKGSVYADRLPMNPLAFTGILHTRASTSGNPSDNRNNHPHSLPGITGVHNGCIWNDREVFDYLGVEPQSDCDSEAIFALLAHSGETVTDALSLLEGDAAVAWIETECPDKLHLARLEGRPLALGQTPKGSMIFASTVELLRLSCKLAGVQLKRSWSIPEWTYIVVERGTVVDLQTFKPERPTPCRHTPARSFSYYGRTGREVFQSVHGDDEWWDPRDHVPAGLGLGVADATPVAVD